MERSNAMERSTHYENRQFGRCSGILLIGLVLSNAPRAMLGDIVTALRGSKKRMAWWGEVG